MQWSESQRHAAALAAAVVAPLLVSVVLVPFRSGFANTDAALLLVVVVVAVAATGDRSAGYVAAVSSAVWFDFFLTQPYLRLTINRARDLETTVLLVVIGAAVTELAVWGRRQQAASSRRAGYVSGLYAAAEAASPDELVRKVSDELVGLLGLRACRFQSGVAGVGVAGRLHHDGRLTVGGNVWSVEKQGLPAEGVELLAQGGGYLQGRFLLTPEAGSRPALESRLVAATLADQVGAALAGQHHGLGS